MEQPWQKFRFFETQAMFGCFLPYRFGTQRQGARPFSALALPASVLLLLAVGCTRSDSPIASAPPHKQGADPTPAKRPSTPFGPDLRRPEPEPPQQGPPQPPEPDPSVGVTAAVRSEEVPGARPILTAVWDFATLAPGSEARRRFTITNTSSGPWTIKFVTKSCSCTAGDFSRKQIQPGEMTWLEVTLRAPAAEGPLRQSVVVDFAEPGAPTVFLIMQGEIRRTFTAIPDSLDLGRLGSDGGRTRTVELHNRGAREVILKVEAPDWLQVEVAARKKDDVRQAWEATLRVDPAKLKPGRTTANVVVRTDSDQVGPLTIPVSVERKALLEVVPDALNFETVTAGQGVRKSALLEADPALGELTTKDLVVTHDRGDELQVSVGPSGRPGRFLVSVEFKPVRSRGTVRGRVELSIRREGVPPASLRLFAEVR